MKKIFAFAAVATAMLFAGNKANAQLGINLGYAPTTFSTTIETGAGDIETDHDMNGFFVGVNYNINLTGDLNVSVGADFRLNTKSDESTTLGITTKTTDKQTLIDIPVLFNYGLSLTNDIRVAAFVGPTFSLALSGETKTTIGSTEGTSDWYDDTDLKKFDIGGTIGLSLSYDGFRLYGGYNLGLMNLSDADNTTAKSSAWFVGLGYAL